MKRDWDVIRKVLLVIEESHSARVFFKDLQSSINIEEKDLQHQIRLMEEAGLLDHMTVGEWHNLDLGWRLTWEGYELIDKIRDDTVWKKTKEVFKEKGVGLPFDLLGQVAGGVLKSMLNLPG